MSYLAHERQPAWKQLPSFLNMFSILVLLIVLLAGCRLNTGATIPVSPSTQNIDLTPLLTVPLPAHVNSLDEILDRQSLPTVSPNFIKIDKFYMNIGSADPVLTYFYSEGGINGSEYGVTFHITIKATYTDTVNFVKNYQDQYLTCKGNLPHEKMDSGTNKGIPYQYCISSLTELHDGVPIPGIGSLEVVKYTGSAFVQRGNLFIEITRGTSFPEPILPNKAISLLARAMAEKYSSK